MSTQVYTPPMIGAVIRQFNDTVSAQIGDLQMKFDELKKSIRDLRSEIAGLRVMVIANLEGRSKKPTPPIPIMSPCRPSPKAASLEEIQDAVEETLRFTGDLRYRTRRPAVCQARYMFAYAAQNQGYSLPDIGYSLGQHHTSVAYGIRQVKKWIKEQPDWAELVRKVEEQL